MFRPQPPSVSGLDCQLAAGRASAVTERYDLVLSRSNRALLAAIINNHTSKAKAIRRAEIVLATAGAECRQTVSAERNEPPGERENLAARN